MLNKVEEVESALLKAQHIREAISEIASIEDRALLQSLGLEEEMSLSDESSEESTDNVDERVGVSESNIVDITEDYIEILHRCNFNWFQFIKT